MDDTVNSLANTKYGMLWLDIEGTQYWSSSTSNNVDFLQRMVNQGIARGVSMGAYAFVLLLRRSWFCLIISCALSGIYSSSSQWTPIMGGSTQFSKYPLWYAHYDNNPSFSDFKAFGGWSTPNIKQYAGTTSLCSASVDLSWY
jgi:hypothetical protein